MHDSGTETEKQVQFEKDGAAFAALSPHWQRAANSAAAAAFSLRWAITGLGKLTLGIVEAVVNVVFKFPYVFLKYCTIGLANGVVRAAKLGVAAGAAGARRLVSPKSKKIAAWEKETVIKIDKVWRETKESLRQGVQQAAEFAEYYGALGLYRAATWIFNPRTPSGKPLLINETVNKIAGTALAACAFALLVVTIAKVKAVGLIWHGKIAHSIMTDTSPLYIKVLKQAAFHPVVAACVATVEFATLPVIAASRQALKSTHFTQGIAYQYNVRLREKKNGQPSFRGSVSSLVKGFTRHIVEKASPEFYRARLAHYLMRGQDASSGPLPVPEEGNAGALSQVELAKAFNTNQAAAPAEAPRQNHAPKFM